MNIFNINAEPIHTYPSTQHTLCKLNHFSYWSVAHFLRSGETKCFSWRKMPWLHTEPGIQRGMTKETQSKALTISFSFLTFLKTENAILAFGNDTDSKSAVNQAEAASSKANTPNQHLATSTITTTTISINVDSQQNIFHPQIPTQVNQLSITWRFCTLWFSVCVGMYGWRLCRSMSAAQATLLMQDTWPEGKTVGVMNEWR